MTNQQISHLSQYLLWKSLYGLIDICMLGYLSKQSLKLILQRIKANYRPNFMWPCLFCESIISDYWAQTSFNWFKVVFMISIFWLTNLNVVIPIEIIPGQKLPSQIWQSELLIGHYSEITEPVNVFWYVIYLLLKNLKYGSVTCIIWFGL